MARQIRSTPSKFTWRDHPIGKFAKILCYLVGQQAAEKSHGRNSAIPRSTLWAEVVTKRMPYLPDVWARATGRPLTPGTLHNRLYYMYREHQNGGGPGRLIETVSAEHPTRSARLRPYVPGVRLCFEQITGEIRCELAEWICAEPAPSVDAIRTKLGYDEVST